MADPALADPTTTGRMMAALDVIAHTGVTDVEIAYDDDVVEGPAEVLWHVKANWSGHRVISEHHPDPAGAAEDVARRVLAGGLCTHCSQPTVFGLEVPGRCCLVLIAGDLTDPSSYRYRRSCAPPSGCDHQMGSPVEVPSTVFRCDGCGWLYQLVASSGGGLEERVGL